MKSSELVELATTIETVIKSPKSSKDVKSIDGDITTRLHEFFKFSFVLIKQDLTSLSEECELLSAIDVALSSISRYCEQSSDEVVFTLFSKMGKDIGTLYAAMIAKTKGLRKYKSAVQSMNDETIKMCKIFAKKNGGIYDSQLLKGIEPFFTSLLSSACKEVKAAAAHFWKVTFANTKELECSIELREALAKSGEKLKLPSSSKANITKVTENTPKRRRDIFDEDSVSFVAIETTPKKMKLTEHQKEAFQEREYVGFLDGESQQSSQLPVTKIAPFFEESMSSFATSSEAVMASDVKAPNDDKAKVDSENATTFTPPKVSVTVELPKNPVAATTSEPFSSEFATTSDVTCTSSPISRRNKAKSTPSKYSASKRLEAKAKIDPLKPIDEDSTAPMPSFASTPRTKRFAENSVLRSPSTPGILRNYNSPSLSEKKRMRVHFIMNEDGRDAVQTTSLDASEKADEKSMLPPRSPIRSLFLPEDAEPAKPTDDTSDKADSFDENELLPLPKELSPIKVVNSAIFSPLINCEEDVAKIISSLTPIGAASASIILTKQLESKGITLIAHLAKLTRAEAELLPIKKPKTKTLMDALLVFAKKRDLIDSAQEQLFVETGSNMSTQKSSTPSPTPTQNTDASFTSEVEKFSTMMDSIDFASNKENLSTIRTQTDALLIKLVQFSAKLNSAISL